MSALLLALLACARVSRPVGALAQEEADVEAALSPALRLDDVRDVACEGDVCSVLARDSVWRLPVGATVAVSNVLRAPAGAWDTLAVQGGALTLGGGCPPAVVAPRCTARPAGDGGRVDPSATAEAPALLDDALPLAEEVAGIAATHAAVRAHGWRTPFARSYVDPRGGLVRLVRAMGGAELVRTNAPNVVVAGGAGEGRVRPTAVRVAMPEAAAAWPAWLLLHPSGQEAYLLAWPSRRVVALDPVALRPRWELPLEDAGHGLFLDASGRYLLIAEGPFDRDLWTDWPVLAPASASGPGGTPAPDPLRDEVLRGLPQPPTEAVLVIDLAHGEQVMRLPGAHRRWSLLPDGRMVLATTQAVGFFTPEPPPARSGADALETP